MAINPNTETATLARHIHSVVEYQRERAADWDDDTERLAANIIKDIVYLVYGPGRTDAVDGLLELAAEDYALIEV